MLGISLVSAAAIDARLAKSAYAPVSAACPSTSLVRAASGGLSSSESTYATARKAIADTSLASWLKSANSDFDTSSLPALALTVSGGGYRSLLCGAGVIQGFDSRDSSVGTSGIFQGLTYQAGLSGGAWLTSSFAGNNWPTISSLKTSLWEDAFADSLLLPEKFLAAVAYAEIAADIIEKDEAGYDPTLTDVWGRLLSYQLLDGSDGGVATRLSSLTSFSNFTSHAVPYPIITSLGLSSTDTCLPTLSATQYEFHPYEFGSWDSGVSAFTQTEYLGSRLTNGEPTTTGVCTTQYDNLGYVLGTSSTLFNEVCSVIPAQNDTSDIDKVLEGIVAKVHTPVLRDLFAVYPNPFYKYTASTAVSSETELELVDGGEELQNNPIWPFLNADRADVLIVNDNSADTDDNFPNGTEIYTTYVQAQAVGLTKMPTIPPVSTFVSEGLNKRATFFGCDEADALTIVYLPNVNYTFTSNESTEKFQYSKAQTDAMVANGVLIADQNGDEEWPTCLGCAVLKKEAGELPSACTACFTKYCYSS
ncbi:Lysophospholipase 1 [Zalaria obscura]|uniref:Lysophospholipase 1 n=1 Tax=Zalaria obscura TaxID=2024903 RepID=A0ACC3SA96_9PEZI